MQTALVRNLRNATKRKEKAFLGRICSVLNSEGKYNGRGGADSLGIDMVELLKKSHPELQARLEAIDEDSSKPAQAEKSLIRRMLARR